MEKESNRVSLGSSFSVNVVMPLASVFAASHRRGNDKINAEEVSNRLCFGNALLSLASPRVRGYLYFILYNYIRDDELFF